MIETNMNQYIRSVALEGEYDCSRYPFSLKAIKDFKQLDLHPKVTYIIGENGSGKSTLLEAIAIAYGFNPEGGTRNLNFETSASHSILHDYMRLVKGIRAPKDGFFLRAESFYNVASHIDEIDRYGGLGRPIIESYGGLSLHKQSHGESFMSLMVHRFGGHGVYILDEPEAALSPTRQLALLSRMHELIEEGSQFIIATHSPIVMGYPESAIYLVDNGMKQVDYEETEHYQVMKQFMNHREGMLKHLL